MALPHTAHNKAAPQNGCSQIVIYTLCPTSPDQKSAKLNSTGYMMLQNRKGWLSHMVQVEAKIFVETSPNRYPLPISYGNGRSPHTLRDFVQIQTLILH